MAVRIELADRTPLTGSLYADVVTADGAPGRLVDRLNAAVERFVPLAVGDRHVLLRKSGVALVRMNNERDEQPRASSESHAELKLRLTLISGTSVQGSVRARLPRQRSRALDFLNLNSRAFVEVMGGDGHLTLVNSDHIARVIEVLDLGS